MSRNRGLGTRALFVPSGLYFARLTGPPFLYTAKLMILPGNRGASRASILRMLPHHLSPLGKAAAAVDTSEGSAGPVTGRPRFRSRPREQANLTYSLSDTTVSMARLIALTTSAGSLTPAFAPAVLAYSITVPDSVASIRLIPKAAPPIRASA